MKSMTLYVEKNTFVHGVDPITKIVYIIVASALPYILPNIALSLIVTAISLSLLLIGKVFRRILPIIGVSIILIISLLIVQGLVYEGNVTPFIQFGKVIFYEEGLLYGTLLLLRVINMLSAFGVLILTTKPDHLVEALIKKGMSPRIGYVIGSVLQLIPQMSSTIGTITDAQRSRGLETEGKLLTRIKAFIPLIGPVIMNSLISTRERAIALEVRGFNSKVPKSFLHEAEDFKYSKLVQSALILILIGAIVWRIFL